MYVKNSTCYWTLNLRHDFDNKSHIGIFKCIWHVSVDKKKEGKIQESSDWEDFICL